MERYPRSTDFLDDFFCGGCPYERFWVLVMSLDKFIAGLFQISDALEDTTAETFLGELAEEAFDDVEPGAAGRQ